jgi:hypothetical protein
VKVAAGGVKNIRHTLGAGGSIDGHFSADGGGLTGANGKIDLRNSSQGQGLALHGGDPGQGGRLPLQAEHQVVNRLGGARHPHQHPLAIINHLASQTQLLSQTIDGGPEAHPLYRPPDAN